MPFDFFFPKTPQGAPTGAQAKKSPRCPNCKALLQPGAAQCDSCGYVLPQSQQ